eukprot:jgi/Botrbrau1/18702/Bobra.0386s0028.1
MPSGLRRSDTFNLNRHRPRTESDSSRIWANDFNDFAKAHHFIHTVIGILLGLGITVVLATRSTYPTWQSKVAAAFIFTVISTISVLLLLKKNMPVVPHIREELMETALVISLHVASLLLGPLQALNVDFSDSFVHAALAQCQLLCHSHGDLRQHLLNLAANIADVAASKYLAPGRGGDVRAGPSVHSGRGGAVDMHSAGCVARLEGPPALFQSAKDRPLLQHLERRLATFTGGLWCLFDNCGLSRSSAVCIPRAGRRPHLSHRRPPVANRSELRCVHDRHLKTRDCCLHELQLRLSRTP